MRRNPDFVLKNIGKTPFLLVTGIRGESPSKAIRLNESGQIIWKLLDRDMTKDELVVRCQEYFECDGPEEKELIKNQVLPFVDEMIQQSAFLDYAMTVEEKQTREFEISEEHYEDPVNEPKIGDYKIGRLGLEIFGDESVLPDNFKEFLADTEGAEAVQKIVLTYWPEEKELEHSYLSHRYDMDQRGYIGSSGLAIYKARKGFVILYDQLPIRWLFISKDGKFAEIVYAARGEEGVNAIYETTRMAFSFFAEQNGHIVLHSASLLHKDKAVLFSAMSGVGKSTHAALWIKNFNSHIFNGDVNLLTMEGGQPIVYGLPWCGTSENFEKGRYPLGAIVMLQRGEKNSIEELRTEEKTVLLLNRLISPNWIEEQLNMLLDILEPVVSGCDIFTLYCNMEDQAAILCKERVEINCH